MYVYVNKKWQKMIDDTGNQTPSIVDTLSKQHEIVNV